MFKKKIISISAYIIAILFLIFYLFLELSPNIDISEFGRLFLLCGSCLFLYIGGFCWSKYKNNNKAMRINLWIFFILYLVLLITLTLFDTMWGRQGFNIFHWSSEGLKTYLESNFNIVPFATITEYIKLFNSLQSTSSIMFNLLGNIVALMPMALFLPLLFKKQNNFKIFLLTITVIVLCIELAQFITFSGSCDIDDLILNVLGAMVLYGILRIKSVNNLIRNIFLLEKNKVEVKTIIKVAIPIIIVVILVILLIKYRTNLYNDNLQEYTNKYNFHIEILDESENTGNALEKFYEDEYYNYYFNTTKSDYVYALINGKEKYLVKDLLNNNPTDYRIRIEDFERANLDFIKEPKYEEIKINGIGNVYSSIEIKDENILEIDCVNSVFGVNAENPNEETYEMQFFIIPLEAGSTEVEIKLIETGSDIINKIKKYSVTVKEDLSVDYEEIS